ncbi:MFS transporter [Microtetraspora sp. NBRC 13810]|uniref:MFS transporter n=1 Tax=Microtetraspora sp. NBRC 13810 TaxID=3030990 RepID=UPI0024A50AD8|nr:MFS transporter [Microtetraspora sp. NBRC 13810]GLW05833.1 MFS transporter [Microtetraspora sp. NBRC 13810]
MNQGSGGDPPAGQNSLRRNWRFQFLWAGAGISYLGDSTVGLALPLLVLAATGSPVLTGVATTIAMVSGLLVSAPAGVWVDRMDRRRILIGAEGVLALVWGAFAVLVYLEAVSAWNVILVSVISGSAGAFKAPAHAAAIQALVPKPQLATAYAQNQARSYATQLAGPPLGGLLYSLGRGVPFVFQALSSVFSMLCYLAAKVPRRPAEPARKSQAGTSMRSAFAEAFRWLLAQRGLRAVIGVALFMNPLVNAIWIPIIVLVGERGGESLDTGIIMAGAGVGGLAGSLLSTRLSRLLPPGKLLLLVCLLMGGSYCLIPLPFGTPWPMVPIIVSCLASPALNVALMALMGNLVPSAMMGRMMSVVALTFQGFSPLGPVIGGFLAGALGGAGALVACGVSLLVITAIASTSTALRSLRGPEDEHDEPGEPDEPDGPAQPPPADGGKRADLDAIRQLRELGVVVTDAGPEDISALRTLKEEEILFLTSLNSRIRTAVDADVMAHDSSRERPGE